MVYYSTEEKFKTNQEEVNILTEKIECEKKNMEETNKILDNEIKLLKITEEKIAVLKSNIKEKNDILENLKSRLDELKAVISNTKVIDTIVVDDERNKLMWNGLVCLNRDILMKLIKIIIRETKIRRVHHYFLSFLSFFLCS
jgi:predicted RNase H-like nuclease (RuvC/YqgF family)